MDSLLAAIGNLAIQVDKIASNQARLNVEVDALKNNNHDDKGSPSSSYQAIPVASASSSASQTKLEQAILRGEFVNFIDLLKSQREHVTQEANAVTLDDRGNLILQKARPQTIDSFSTWLSAWFEFEKIIVSAHPERYAELAEYRVVIHKANRKFAWPAVNAYDIRFRQETARSGGRRFDQIDHTLYTTTLDATALRKDVKQCFRCKSFDHEAKECPFLPAPALETSAQNKNSATPSNAPSTAWKTERWYHDGK